MQGLLRNVKCAVEFWRGVSHIYSS